MTRNNSPHNIHLNGTAGSDLFDAYRKAMDAMSDANESLNKTSPNARDYYVQNDSAYTSAMDEHIERLNKLNAVFEELKELAIHCMENDPKRK